jgi:hypothetical protein
VPTEDQAPKRATEEPCVETVAPPDEGTLQLLNATLAKLDRDVTRLAELIGQCADDYARATRKVQRI